MDNEKDIIRKFFSPIAPPSAVAPDYGSVEVLKDMCDVLARLLNQSVYVIDYSRRNFFHVSSHPLFLCGYTAGEVQRMGYAFYGHVVPPADLRMLLRINETGWRLFYDVPPERRLFSRIAYDFHMRTADGRTVLVHHKLSPCCLLPDGNVWLALCLVSESAGATAGNVLFSDNDQNCFFGYDVEQDQIFPTELKTLTEQERQVFVLSMRGLTEIVVSRELGISVSTVKKHRMHIVQKLGTTNMASAVALFKQNLR